MESLKTLITFTLPHDAHLAKGLLESEGIETFMKDEFTAQVNNFYSNAIGGVKLQVKVSDYEEGLLILKKGGYINAENSEEINVELVKLNNTTDQTICPFCQSENIGKKKQLNILSIIVYFILGFISPIFKKSYVCYDCEKIWKFSKAAVNTYSSESPV